jgi:hypothetical protein
LVQLAAQELGSRDSQSSGVFVQQGQILSWKVANQYVRHLNHLLISDDITGRWLDDGRQLRYERRINPEATSSTSGTGVDVARLAPLRDWGGLPGEWDGEKACLAVARYADVQGVVWVQGESL